MAYRCFDVDVTDRVAHLRLSRPDELNTMTADFWRELPGDRDRPERRGQRPLRGHQQHRQALQRRDGPVGLHRART
jgi:hypothetical protein